MNTSNIVNFGLGGVIGSCVAKLGGDATGPALLLAGIAALLVADYIWTETKAG